jgi:hypothetical protein
MRLSESKYTKLSALVRNMLQNRRRRSRQHHLDHEQDLQSQS